MTRIEEANGGNIPNPDKQTASVGIPILSSDLGSQILLADASRSFQMAKRLPVINLIVSRYKNGRRGNYLIPNVNANAFCRDLVNATLNNNLRRVRGIV
jgi:hypothetical protein